MTDSEQRLRRLKIWSGPIDVAPLHGGLSNESYLVRDFARRFVVRFGRDFPFHHVLRERELMTARAAAQAGFAPKVVHAEPGVMVTDFIESETYDAARVRADIAGIAQLLRRFHHEMPGHVSGPGFMFWVFHVIRDYAKTLDAGRSRMRERLAGYVTLGDRLEALQIPLPIVFAHNDLLPANFLHDGKRLWIIDFEYAGFSTAMFDLAGVASNAEFDDVEAGALLTAYFGRPPEPELARSHGAMQCASLLREAMWSMVSELHLDAPGVDYEAYTAVNLDRLERALDAFQSRYGKVQDHVGSV